MTSPQEAALVARQAEDIQVGDLLLNVLGTDRLVTAIEPYVGTLFAPDEARIAHSGSDWSITLIKGQTFRVASEQRG